MPVSISKGENLNELRLETAAWCILLSRDKLELLQRTGVDLDKLIDCEYH